MAGGTRQPDRGKSARRQGRDWRRCGASRRELRWQIVERIGGDLRSVAVALSPDRATTGYFSKLRLQSSLLAQLVGSDSVKNAVPLNRDRRFAVGVDRVFPAFAQQ